MTDDAARESLQDALRARERVLPNIAAVTSDRLTRWALLLADREESATIRQWVGAMSAKYQSDTVRVWNSPVPWITALYIVRYGESEHYWPASLTPADERRAQRWLAGDIPLGVALVLP